MPNRTPEQIIASSYYSYPFMYPGRITHVLETADSNALIQGNYPFWKVCDGSVVTLDINVYGNDLLDMLTWTDPDTQAPYWKSKTLAEWNALSTAAGGIGGVPFFAVADAAQRQIKLPDLRGDYLRGYGSDGHDVGAWHGDAIRNVTGNFVYSMLGTAGGSFLFCTGDGAFKPHASTTVQVFQSSGSIQTSSATNLSFSASQVVPTANENRTRGLNMLPIVHLGSATQ